MAVDQVSTRSIPALNASGTQDAGGLREGTVLDGRIVAVNSDDTLRIATRSGMIDVDPAQISIAGENGPGKLPPLADLIGTSVKLEVTGQSAATNRYVIRLISSGDPAAPDVATTSLGSEIASRIATEVAQAAARQDGLAQVFADASQLAGASEALPDAVSIALADLSGFALDGSQEITGDDIRSAISSSGLFFEAKLAKLAAGVSDDGGLGLKADAGLGAQDMKAALFGLKSALDQWIAEASAGAPDLTETVASGQADQAGEATSLTAVAAQMAESEAETLRGFDTEALFAVLRPPPVVAATAPQPAPSFSQAGTLASQLITQAAGRPDLVTMATIGEWFQTSGQAPVGGGRRGAYGNSLAALDRQAREMPAPEGATSGRPPPPRRGSLPQGQPALSTESAGRQPLDIARDLALKTGNALARVSLGQYASLPEKTATATSASQTSSNAAASKSPASWLFEIPLNIGAATSIVQFEIDQIAEGTVGEADYKRAWRVQFSLDVAPLGPVHVRLVLSDKKLSVGLWAEGRIAATGMQRGIAALRQSLESAQFEVDEIHFAQGRPPSGPPVKAGGFIDRNA